MAKAVALVSALCVLAVVAASVVHAHKEKFHVEGDVYCDPCRVQFETELSYNLAGATVRLECRDIETKTVTYSMEGVTGSDGHYSLTVKGDHEKDICEVMPVTSPKAECSEPMGEYERAKIECTENSGLHNPIRYANPIGFMTREVAPECAPILANLATFNEETN
ncbi:Anther-specific protein LAT52 [Sesamum angolense]|uniref:Anther-specific protein LAT52 n=1 Tax=Sesamum angolense TaxID=2727404 RepID=A0AAE1W5P9_9LAMI|nr:Anther-specific protein LAT52 [Sesamum angolense]